MILYFLRHAIAVPRGTKGYKDEDRPLTIDGRQKMEAIAAGMLALELDLGRIVSSPYLRARQTAEIVGRAFGMEVGLWKSLAPTASPTQSIANLLKVHDQSVLLVGHEPHLSEFISVLICGNPAARIELKKGGLGKLRSDRLGYGRCATLEWMLTPAQLRRLR